MCTRWQLLWESVFTNHSVNYANGPQMVLTISVQFQPHSCEDDSSIFTNNDIYNMFTDHQKQQ
jgi:hypothetical protein